MLSGNVISEPNHAVFVTCATRAPSPAVEARVLWTAGAKCQKLARSPVKWNVAKSFRVHGRYSAIVSIPNKLLHSRLQLAGASNNEICSLARDLAASINDFD